MPAGEMQTVRIAEKSEREWLELLGEESGPRRLDGSFNGHGR